MEGWKNLVWENPEVEALAKSRAEICSICPDNKNGTCKLCGCVLAAKVRATKAKCPVLKW